MTDAEREAQKWVGDEATIRRDHERDRKRQNGKIGSHGSVSPYGFSTAEILLLRLDEARGAYVQAAEAAHKLQDEVDNLTRNLLKLQDEYNIVTSEEYDRR